MDEQHTAIRADAQRAKYRELGPGGSLSVGDYVLVKKAPEYGTSVRFQVPTFNQVYQVVEVHGSDQDAKAYTLCDLVGSREDLGFTQPVALDRLIPIDLLPLAQVADDQSTHILINDRGRDRQATVKAQAADGRVYIQYDGEEVEHCVDLSSSRYQWI